MSRIQRIQDLPPEMLGEIVKHADDTSTLCLALASKELFDLLTGRISIKMLRKSSFLNRIIELGHENQFDWLWALIIVEEAKAKGKRSSLKWHHFYKASKSGNISLLQKIEQVSLLFLSESSLNLTFSKIADEVSFDTQLADAAAKHGHIPILQYLLDKGVFFLQETYRRIGLSGRY